MEKVTLESPVSVLSGVGPARMKALAAMGISTLRDLVYHFPRSYENRGDIFLLADGIDGEKHAFNLTVASQPSSAKIRADMTLTKFKAFDESGTIEVVYFNQPYMKDAVKLGNEYRFYGKLQPNKRTYQMISPAFEPISDKTALLPFVPVYPLSEGLSRKIMTSLVTTALNLLLPVLVDPLPESIRTRHELPTLSYALNHAHTPESKEELSLSLRRLIFDEFFYFSLALKKTGRKVKSAVSPLCPKINLFPFLSILPYELTGAQKRVTEEIAGDLSHGDGSGKAFPMSRILIGDVGCGKTVCAEAAAYTVMMSRHQVAVMAPTEILARQHFEEMEPLFAKLGFHTVLLLGSTRVSERKSVYADIENGNADLIIGTHALLNPDLHFADLGLVITDEQHRFGVMQRAALCDKGVGTHLLVMSATPIPRTLALTLYGDLAVSRIDEMPKGRSRVDTFVVNTSYRERLHAFIRKNVAEGGQIYIVCPAIEPPAEEETGDIDFEDMASHSQSTALPLTSAVTLADSLSRDVFPDLRIACLHGKMKSSEKEQIMSTFVNGNIDILVSTTVIEVGINVPNACLMIIENAERFGLSQLHQLRGRVGRGNRKSYCVLISDAEGEIARERLEVMHTSYDGYEIAEKDLRLRGPGDFFAADNDSIRQSGGMPFRLMHLCDDADLMQSAFAEAKTLAESDCELVSPEHRGIANELAISFILHENTVS